MVVILHLCAIAVKGFEFLICGDFDNNNIKRVLGGMRHRNLDVQLDYTTLQIEDSNSILIIPLLVTSINQTRDWD
jgi:hypothetical protein